MAFSLAEALSENDLLNDMQLKLYTVKPAIAYKSKSFVSATYYRFIPKKILTPTAVWEFFMLSQPTLHPATASINYYRQNIVCTTNALEIASNNKP